MRINKMFTLGLAVQAPVTINKDYYLQLALQVDSEFGR